VRHGPIRESATQPGAKKRLVDEAAANGVKYGNKSAAHSEMPTA